MKLTAVLELRRIMNYSYHPFKPIPKPSKWLRRERLHRLTAWQFAVSRNTVKMGFRQLNKVFSYMDMQRVDEPRAQIHFATERLKSGLAEHHARYPTFKNMLDKAHILLDKKVLSQMVIYEPRSFEAIVELTQKMALEEDRIIYQTKEELEHVEINTSLFRQPYAHSRLFIKGPSEDHRIRPRKLKEVEF
uniref:Uncharacterized protein n=1 Tax=Ditylenchus dipsaci TaxID=166011 RepID=A0A915EJM6_9BILA